MIYILDTNIIRKLVSHFPKKGLLYEMIWNSIDERIAEGTLISVDEVYNELCKTYSESTDEYKWIKQHKAMFINPTNEESIVIRELFLNPKFVENIHQKNILSNRPSADPYLVAKAKVLSAVVVTEEKYKPHSAQLPNLCESLNVKCIGYDDFMEIISSN